jgi:hypothetical protein
MGWDALTAISTFATFIVIAASAIAALKQLRHMNAGNHINAALALMDKWSSPEFASAGAYVYGGDLEKNLQDPAYRQELMRTPVNRERHPETVLLGYWEQVGSLVKQGFIAEAALMDIASLQCVAAWQRLSPVVAIMRRARGPLVMDNFEYLASRCMMWEAKHANDEFPHGTPHLGAQDLWPQDDALQTASQ